MIGEAKPLSLRCPAHVYKKSYGTVICMARHETLSIEQSQQSVQLTLRLTLLSGVIKTRVVGL